MSDPISYMPFMVKKDNDDCYQCEMCGRSMDKVDYDYCDICGDCLDSEGGFTI
jgi:ribosomal protein L37E